MAILSKPAAPAIVPAITPPGGIQPLAPALTDFNPKRGSVGTSVTITFSENISGVTKVDFNGVNAPDFQVTGNTVTVVVPPGASTGPINITTQTFGVFSTPSNFEVTGPPMIQGLPQPQHGPEGTSIRISGANFVDPSDPAEKMENQIVIFSPGVQAITQPMSATLLTTVVPAGAMTGPIEVQNAAGTSNPVNFIVDPAISSFTPTSGAPGTQVMIQGTTFLEVTGVQFNGQNAAGFTIQSNNKIVATVPTLPDGIGPTGPICVLRGNDKFCTAPPNTFTILPSPPAVTDFEPKIGIPGMTVMITGRHLESINMVKFNGAIATILSKRAKEIDVTVPTGATTGPLVLSGPNGSVDAGQFVIPVITGITPTSGPVGSTVKIQGDHLGKASKVVFTGNVSGGITSQGGKMIQVMVPKGAQTGVITVQFPGFTLPTPVFTVTS